MLPEPIRINRDAFIFRPGEINVARRRWPIFLIFLFLPLAAMATADPVPANDSIGTPFGLLVVLLIFAAYLILVGVGIILALAGLAFSAILVAFGVVSTSTFVALVRRRVSAGLRAFHYQLFALTAAPCGVMVLGLGTWLFHLHLRQRYILLFGSFAGVGAGIALAFLLDRIVHLIYHRFISRNEFVSTPGSNA